MANNVIPRNASATLKTVWKYVAELAPWFGIGRMLCKVGAILAKHGELFFAEAESFCLAERDRARDQLGEDAPAASSEAAA